MYCFSLFIATNKINIKQLTLFFTLILQETLDFTNKNKFYLQLINKHRSDKIIKSQNLNLNDDDQSFTRIYSNFSNN